MPNFYDSILFKTPPKNEVQDAEKENSEFLEVPIKIFLTDIDPQIPIEVSRKIVDTRNSVSEDVLWLIIVNYLPNLEKQLKELLEK